MFNKINEKKKLTKESITYSKDIEKLISTFCYESSKLNINAFYSKKKKNAIFLIVNDRKRKEKSISCK